MVTMSTTELLEAIAAAQGDAMPDDPPGAFRVVEVAERLGWSVKRVQAQLRAWQVAGRLERTQVWRLDLAGRRMPIPAYRLREAA
jgi:hypothetical protein